MLPLSQLLHLFALFSLSEPNGKNKTNIINNLLFWQFLKSFYHMICIKLSIWACYISETWKFDGIVHNKKKHKINRVRYIEKMSGYNYYGQLKMQLTGGNRALYFFFLLGILIKRDSWQTQLRMIELTAKRRRNVLKKKQATEESYSLKAAAAFFCFFHIRFNAEMLVVAYVPKYHATENWESRCGKLKIGKSSTANYGDLFK